MTTIRTPRWTRRRAGSMATRWQRVAMVAGAVPAAAALTLASGAVAPAAAFDGPNGHHQFVLIDTDGAPLWRAEMRLYDKTGALIYVWQRPGPGGAAWASGGKATWWYTAVDRGYVRLLVDTVDYPEDMLWNTALDVEIKDTDDPGNCVKINPVGSILGWDAEGLKFKDEFAPSLQPSSQGCTPD